MNPSPLKAKTRQQIARELEISESTFRRWLKRRGIVLPKGLVMPAEQKLIYQKFYSDASNGSYFD